MFLYTLYITLFLGILPLGIQLVKHKKLWSKNRITPFVWLTAIASFYEYIGTLLLQLNSSFWFQLYPLLSILAILYFFNNVLSPKRLILIKLLFLIFIVFYSISFFFLNTDTFISSSLNRISISAIVFILTILWFKELFDELSNLASIEKKEFKYLWESENFFFVAGLFLYYTTTFFLFLSSTTIYKSELYFYDYWFVNIIATLVLRLFLIISVWKMSKV